MGMASSILKRQHILREVNGCHLEKISNYTVVKKTNKENCDSHLVARFPEENVTRTSYGPTYVFEITRFLGGPLLTLGEVGRHCYHRLVDGLPQVRLRHRLHLPEDHGRDL